MHRRNAWSHHIGPSDLWTLGPLDLWTLGLDSLNHRGSAHSASDAERDQSQPPLVPAQFMNHRRREASAGTPKRMSERNRPTVDVQAIGIDLEVAKHREHLGREGFVELDEIDV